MADDKSMEDIFKEVNISSGQFMDLPGMRDDGETGTQPEPRASNVDTSGLKALDDPEVRRELGMDERSDDPNDLNNAMMNGYPEIKEIGATIQQGLDEAKGLMGELPGMKDDWGKSR